MLIATGWSTSGVAEGIFVTGLATEVSLIAAGLAVGVDGAATDGSGTIGVSSSSNEVIWSLAMSRYPVDVKRRVELALCSLRSKWMENPFRRLAIWPARADIWATIRSTVTVNNLENLMLTARSIVA